VMRVLRVYSVWGQYRDPWATFMKQMAFLRAHLPGAKLAGKIDAADEAMKG